MLGQQISWLSSTRYSQRGAAVTRVLNARELREIEGGGMDCAVVFKAGRLVSRDPDDVVGDIVLVGAVIVEPNGGDSVGIMAREVQALCVSVFEGAHAELELELVVGLIRILYVVGVAVCSVSLSAGKSAACDRRGTYSRPSALPTLALCVQGPSKSLS